jgi:hypothetical protein
MEDVVSNLRGRSSFEQPFAKDAAIGMIEIALRYWS